MALIRFAVVVAVLLCTCDALYHRRRGLPSRSVAPGSGAPVAPGPVLSLPGYQGAFPRGHYSGHVVVNTTCEAALFFYFAEAREAAPDSPVLLWLNGGPGASSMLGFLMENGPFQTDGVRLWDNPAGWNRRNAYLAIDQPAGTGYAFASQASCYPTNVAQSTRQLMSALEQIFALLAMKGRALILAGESYAGTYVPLLAQAILQSPTTPLKLVGQAVGDGWVAPALQQATYAEYAYSHGLVSPAQRVQVDALYSACAAEIAKHVYPTTAHANDVCNRIEEFIGNVSNAFVYDVRLTSDYNYTGLMTYLNTPAVTAALHVDPRALPYAMESDTIGDLFAVGEQDSYAFVFGSLFDRLPTLVYNGVYDMDCNMLGTNAWLDAVQWSGAHEWRTLSIVPWFDANATQIGMTRGHGLLQQRIVYGAGHLVPIGQPAAALFMIEDWIASIIGHH